jgi:hypothetical protein
LLERIDECYPPVFEAEISLPHWTKILSNIPTISERRSRLALRRCIPVIRSDPNGDCRFSITLTNAFPLSLKLKSPFLT